MPDSFVREDGGTMATFALTAGDEVLPAVNNGVVSYLFFNEHSEIILQGGYSEGHSCSCTHKLALSCPKEQSKIIHIRDIGYI